MRGALEKIALSLATLLLVFLAGEALIRILEHSGLLPSASGIFENVPYSSQIIEIDDTVLIWGLDPSSPLVNAAGFRGRDYEIIKPAGVRRIAVLGDSVSFGRGVPDAEIFTNVLQDLLNQDAEAGSTFEVLNFGVGGYNTQQEVEFYRSTGRRYAPDLVVVAYVLNDPFTTKAALNILSAALKKEEAAAPAGDAAGQDALSLPRSRLARFVRVRAEGSLKKREPKSRPPFVEKAHSNPEGWKMVEDSFAALAALAKEDEIPVVLAILPLFLDFDDYPFEAIHEKVAQAGGRHGFRVLDVYRDLEGRDAAEFRLDHHDSTHPNAAGHRAIARRLYEFIQGEQLLEREARSRL